MSAHSTDQLREAAAEAMLIRMGLEEHTAKEWQMALELATAGLDAALKGAERVWLCREKDRVQDWAEGSPPHCWFRADSGHYPECGFHLVIPSPLTPTDPYEET